MSSYWVLAALVIPTVVLAVVIRLITRRFDGLLLILSGTASLFLAVFASTAMKMQDADGMMAFEMSEKSFNIGVLSPVFIVATLTVMRGIFKFLGE